MRSTGAINGRGGGIISGGVRARKSLADVPRFRIVQPQSAPAKPKGVDAAVGNAKRRKSTGEIVAEARLGTEILGDSTAASKVSDALAWCAAAAEALKAESEVMSAPSVMWSERSAPSILRD